LENENCRRVKMHKMKVGKTRVVRAKDQNGLPRPHIENENGERFPVEDVVFEDVKCAVCGAELGDVPATMPVPDTCDECFAAFANWAAAHTPAQVLAAHLDGTIAEKIKQAKERGG
jgi:hypothetical protein